MIVFGDVASYGFNISTRNCSGVLPVSFVAFPPVVSRLGARRANRSLLPMALTISSAIIS